MGHKLPLDFLCCMQAGSPWLPGRLRPNQQGCLGVRQNMHLRPCVRLASRLALPLGPHALCMELQEGYRADLTLAEAEVLALATLKQVMEEKVGFPSQSALLQDIVLQCIVSQAVAHALRMCAHAGDSEQRGLCKGCAAIPPVHDGGGRGRYRALVTLSLLLPVKVLEVALCTFHFILKCSKHAAQL